MKVIEVGSVVKATAGKEKGKYYIVVKVEGKYAYIADGKRRLANNAKKKSLKHLEILKDKITVLSDRINNGLVVGKKTLYKNLKPYNKDRRI